MSSFLDNLYIRLVLFRIWLFKNILIFVYIAIVVLVTLVLAGVIPKDVPILGQFAQLFYFEDSSLNAVCTSLLSITSVVISVYIICTRIKKIGLSDIKSKKVKVMMAAAGLRFNDNGKIVKNTTLKNKDSNIPIVNTAQEFVTIMSADIDKTKAQNTDNGSDNLEQQIENENNNSDELISTNSKLSLVSKVGKVSKNFFNKFKSSIKNSLFNKDKVISESMNEAAQKITEATADKTEEENTDEFSVVTDNNTETKTEKKVEETKTETAETSEDHSEIEVEPEEKQSEPAVQSEPKAEEKPKPQVSKPKPQNNSQKSAFDAFKSSM